MDWIEKLTGLSPDGGSGTVEALYYVALGAILLVWVRRHGGARRERRRRGAGRG